jgi:Ca-activated chloride channel family protein
MILKYPMVLLLFVPVVGMMYFFHSVKTTHAIRFPKTAWMGQLNSKKATRWLSLTYGLDALVIFLIILTLAQPQWITSERYNTKKGIDIVAILDTSGSMNAEDFKPKNRIEVAKATLNRFIKQRTSDRIGLIIFGSDALTKAPITYDQTILSYHIDQTEVGQAGDGTAIGLAIATGINRLETSTSPSKVIILITDGVNNAGQIDPISAAKLAASKGIKIYTIGIGTNEGAPIPIYHPTYGKRYARTPNGQLVLTQFDDSILKQISSISHGAYFNATNSDELKTIYNDINSLEKTIIQTNKSYITYELFPLLIGLIAAVLLIKEGIILTSLIGVRT